MELRQLRYFVGVVEAGSLLKASARLHVAQPALGLQISSLEEELGTRLFERTSRGMQLTEAGRIFLDHAKVVLNDIERARAAVQQTDDAPRGEVAIGLPTTVALAATVPIVSACRERLPLVRLKVIEAYSGFLREWLQAGRLDVAFLFGDAADPVLSKQPLLDERLALVSRPVDGHLPARIALSRVATVDLVLPSREHGLRRIIDDACFSLGLQLNVVAEIDSLPSVKRAVEAGIGSTILPLAAVAEEVAAKRLRASAIADASMTRRVVLAVNLTRPATRAAAAVASLATELIHDMVRSGSWPGHWIGG
ncbi:LysR substrate-binding domain-containing protein [Azohydromonas lata]|uniref:LysR substrate-binding domain-containing protein n=1 Tax=Azohydromonas lata TaxID=45677 RepID=A0ABU5IHG7_9BURK|nr:LysR substrate-binding domain-containing protein [Azohydromonas lata]MDZ5457941.1 LysR substrate-binding domain-containing protein [Azohydromonas lata]